jgi:predicted SAM-dependent methyltransferase
MRTDLRRLNFGCGHDKRDGYLNVDSDPACKPDVLLVDNDLSVLPEAAFEEILALDVLEHIPRTQTLPVLLAWSDLMVDGGHLRVETSSVIGVVERMHRDPTFANQYGWTQCMFGSQAHAGDFHFTGFTENTLAVHLLAAGFEIDRLWVEEDWLLNVEATKTVNWNAMADACAGLPVEAVVTSAYRQVLLREPDPAGSAFLTGELAAGRMNHRQAFRHLCQAPERLFVTAAQHGR